MRGLTRDGARQNGDVAPVDRQKAAEPVHNICVSCGNPSLTTTLEPKSTNQKNVGERACLRAYVHEVAAVAGVGPARVGQRLRRQVMQPPRFPLPAVPTRERARQAHARRGRSCRGRGRGRRGRGRGGAGGRRRGRGDQHRRRPFLLLPVVVLAGPVGRPQGHRLLGRCARHAAAGLRRLLLLPLRLLRPLLLFLPRARLS